jgi:hypothetical protein
LKEIQKAKISEIEVDVSDLEGAWAAGDIVDTTTGEVCSKPTPNSPPTSFKDPRVGRD